MTQDITNILKKLKMTQASFFYLNAQDRFKISKYLRPVVFSVLFLEPILYKNLILLTLSKKMF